MIRDKNFIKLKELFNVMEGLNTHDIRNLDKDKLVKKFELGELGPCWTFAFLLSSDELEHREKAYQIFQEKSQDKLDEWVLKFNKAEENMEPMEINKHTIKTDLNAIEKKLKRSEEKNQELKSHLERGRKEHQLLKKGFLDEQKKLKKEVIKLQQEIGRLNHENQQLVEENKELNLTNKDLMERLDEKEKSMENWMAKIHWDVLPSDVHINNQFAKKKVALIGDPKNQMIMKAPIYEFHLLNPSELQDMTGETELLHCDEIWLLTYRTPLAQQLYVKRLAEKQKLIEFRNFVELRNHIRERVSP